MPLQNTFTYAYRNKNKNLQFSCHRCELLLLLFKKKIDREKNPGGHAKIKGFGFMKKFEFEFWLPDTSYRLPVTGILYFKIWGSQLSYHLSSAVRARCHVTGDETHQLQIIYSARCKSLINFEKGTRIIQIKRMITDNIRVNLLYLCYPCS